MWFNFFVVGLYVHNCVDWGGIWSPHVHVFKFKEEYNLKAEVSPHQSQTKSCSSRCFLEMNVFPPQFMIYVFS